MQGLIPYISIISIGTELLNYLEISIWQIDGYALDYSQKLFKQCSESDFENIGLNPIEDEKAYGQVSGYNITLFCVDKFEENYISGKEMDFNHSYMMISVRYKDEFSKLAAEVKSNIEA